ncbi:MAG: hypothetical protein ABWY56_14500 [Propionibacteriaceae bacterium]
MKTFVRALTLALMSGVTAEFLLGDQYLQGLVPVGQQLGMLALYTTFYGSAAVLIREVTRRTGRGWPTLLLLAFAFGVFEEGVVDQSLFNPDFAGLRLLDYGHIPGLGTAGPWAVFVLTLHVIWSIGAPVAVGEALFPEPLPDRPAVSPQVQGPWLGRLGIIVCVLGYLLGAVAIYFATVVAIDFRARPLQLILSVLLAAAAVVVALRLRPRPPQAPSSPWPAVAIAFGLTTVFQVTEHYLPPYLPAVVTTLILLLVLAVGVVAVVRLRLDTLGLAAGAILTYGWIGLIKTPALGPVAVIEQTGLVLVALAVLALALVRHRRLVGAERSTVSVG